MLGSESPADLMTKYLSRDVINTLMGKLGQEVREGKAENSLERRCSIPITCEPGNDKVKRGRGTTLPPQARGRLTKMIA